MYKLISVQAVVRAYLARRKYLQRKMLFAANEEFIIKLQAMWRGLEARREYQARLARFKKNEKLFTKVYASIIEKFI